MERRGGPRGCTAVCSECSGCSGCTGLYIAPVPKSGCPRRGRRRQRGRVGWRVRPFLSGLSAFKHGRQETGRHHRARAVDRGGSSLSPSPQCCPKRRYLAMVNVMGGEKRGRREAALAGLAKCRELSGQTGDDDEAREAVGVSVPTLWRSCYRTLQVGVQDSDWASHFKLSFLAHDGRLLLILKIAFQGFGCAGHRS